MPDLSGASPMPIPLEVARAFYGAFSELRPAQVGAAEPLLAGRDVVVLAGTGSGKTEAVSVPLVARLLPDLRATAHPVLLYVAPTRALVNDVERRLARPLDKLGVSLGVQHGERKSLTRVRKPAVLVTTPESLDVTLGKHPSALDFVRAVILDEAHLLYNSQRGLQVAILLARLESRLDRSLQVAAMSATIADAGDLWSFFRPGAEPVAVSDPAPRDRDIRVRIGDTPERLAAMLASLEQPALKVLVFTDSRRECDTLATMLRRELTGRYTVVAHHSSLSKEVRLGVETAMQANTRIVCLATSTLELGIDIGDIDVVILWGPAHGWESFLQRIGRGNRREETTQAVCIVPADRAQSLSAVVGYQGLLHQLDHGAFEADMPRALYGAACQQLLSMALADGGSYIKASHLAAILGRWPHLDQSAVHDMLDELQARDYLVRHPVKRWYGPGPEAHTLESRRTLWANFPLSGLDVAVTSAGREIGRINRENLLQLDVGSVFTLGPSAHRVMRIFPDEIDTKPTTQSPTVMLRFGNRGPGMDPTLLEAAWQDLTTGTDRLIAPRASSDALARSLAPIRGLPVDTLPYYFDEGAVCYLTFAGRLLNGLIAAWLERTGQAIKSVGETHLTTGQPTSLSELPDSIDAFGDLLRSVDPDYADRTQFQDILPTHLYVAEHLDVWHRRPVLRRTLRRIRGAMPVEIPPISGLVAD